MLWMSVKKWWLLKYAIFKDFSMLHTPSLLFSQLGNSKFMALGFSSGSHKSWCNLYVFPILRLSLELNKELRQKILSSRSTSLHKETQSQTNQNQDKPETKKGREEEREREDVGGDRNEKKKIIICIGTGWNQLWI